ncbi:hypothetical protein IEQ34_016951 [Dendrobium chrysotoxum]|uniref:Uncharacterized protein n=1 Tax=Dendrobium chrysotoxum TaxID=161865 RepID=A0AAV7GHT4_DENCH|nr:hypothetical protein IEQ34_016951 [Dendrobium chrysotoxum]
MVKGKWKAKKIGRLKAFVEEDGSSFLLQVGLPGRRNSSLVIRPCCFARGKVGFDCCLRKGSAGRVGGESDDPAPVILFP